MSPLLESLASAFDGVPGHVALDAARREALDAALRDGLPGTRSERWKYTPLRAFERRSFAPGAGRRRRPGRRCRSAWHRSVR